MAELSEKRGNITLGGEGRERELMYFMTRPKYFIFLKMRVFSVLKRTKI